MEYQIFKSSKIPDQLDDPLEVAKRYVYAARRERFSQANAVLMNEDCPAFRCPILARLIASEVEDIFDDLTTEG